MQYVKHVRRFKYITATRHPCTITMSRSHEKTVPKLIIIDKKMLKQSDQ